MLINERIREELRNGNSPQASIHAGYEKAFATIADANVTHMIAALVLCGVVIQERDELPPAEPPG